MRRCPKMLEVHVQFTDSGTIHWNAKKLYLPPCFFQLNTGGKLLLKVDFNCEFLYLPQTDHDPRNHAYIATQGPLETTVCDFWQVCCPDFNFDRSLLVRYSGIKHWRWLEKLEKKYRYRYRQELLKEIWIILILS